jgi:hypothetical protein
MKTGSTMLLSLFDGHPNLLVYPDEPSFHRLFQRRYEDLSHLGRDWLFGTPNPLHFNSVVQATLLDGLGFSPKSLIRPIPRCAPVDGVSFAERIEGVRVRGVHHDRVPDVLDVAAYHRSLASLLSSAELAGPGDVVRATVRALHKAVRFEVRPTRWLFKHPLPRFRSSSLEWFFQEFPAGRMVLLTRDPRGYLSSQIRYAWKRRSHRSGTLWRIGHVLRRLFDLEQDYEAFAALAEREPTRVLVLTYEEIVGDTRSAMERAARFLEIPFDDRMLIPSKLTLPVEVPTATASTKNAVYSDSLAAWQTHLYAWETLAAEAAVSPLLDRGRMPYACSKPAWARRLLRDTILLPMRSLVSANWTPRSP